MNKKSHILVNGVLACGLKQGQLAFSPEMATCNKCRLAYFARRPSNPAVQGTSGGQDAKAASFPRRP